MGLRVNEQHVRAFQRKKEPLPPLDGELPKGVKSLRADERVLTPVEEENQQMQRDGLLLDYKTDARIHTDKTGTHRGEVSQENKLRNQAIEKTQAKLSGKLPVRKHTKTRAQRQEEANAAYREAKKTKGKKAAALSFKQPTAEVDWRKEDGWNDLNNLNPNGPDSKLSN